MLHGTNLEYTKAYNFRIVLETIRKLGPISRADVARQTGLTAQTVSNITRRLIASNLVGEAGQTRVGRGAPATNLIINPDGAFSIGLDLDEEHLTGVLIDLEGRLRQRVYYALSTSEPTAALDKDGGGSDEFDRRRPTGARRDMGHRSRSTRTARSVGIRPGGRNPA